MWVDNLMANASGSILGIQALRNSILSSTFYATACATIAFFAGIQLNFFGLRLQLEKQWVLVASEGHKDLS